MTLPKLLYPGERFGRLVATGDWRVNANRKAESSMRCDCGASGWFINSKVRAGWTRSCGCLHAEAVASMGLRNRTHGHSRPTTPTYASWKSMFDRVTKPSHKSYRYYGGGVVTICARWESFEAFLADMGERPPGKTLDRWPDNCGNYEPSNCRWATNREQALNRRPRAQVVGVIHDARAANR